MLKTVLTFIFILLLLLSGCSTAKRQTLPNTAVSTLVIFPVEIPISSRAERVKLIRSLLISELRNRGFLVVDERLIDAICSTAACPERAQIIEKYAPDGLAEFKLETLSTNDFLLGRFDTIRGRLIVINSQGKEIANAAYSHQEKGGLLLNSGSLGAAFKSISQTFSDDTFEPLAREFVRGLVNELGNPAVSRVDVSALKINQLTFSSAGRGLRQLCIDGTPGALASVKFSNRSTHLTEITPGKYCMAYSIQGAKDSGKLIAELRSPVGLLVNKEFTTPDDSCDLNDIVQTEKLGPDIGLSLVCKPKENEDECNKKKTYCGSLTKVVYSANSTDGPFVKQGEFKGYGLKIKGAASRRLIFSIALKNEGQITSSPVILQP